MLKWFDTKEVDEIADWVVAELIKRSPPEGMDAHPKKEVQRLRKMHDVIFARIDAFARERRLNVYKRARLGNQVKWALFEAKYPSAFTNAFTHEVVTVLTVAHAHAAKTASK